MGLAGILSLTFERNLHYHNACRIRKMMMNEEKILNLVEKGESETLELKRNFNKDAIETIAAFANTKGGTLIFKEANIIEKYGSGIRRILEGFEAHGLPAPKFEEISSGFRVTAFKERKKDTLNDRIKDKIPKYADKDTIKDTIKDTQKDTIKDTIKSQEREKTILQKIKENPSITSEELAKILNINLRNTKKYLAKLKEQGKIKRVGSRKNGIWEVIEK